MPPAMPAPPGSRFHDTVLVAAAFCMFNRYVDGLATFTPPDPAAYHEAGRRMARDGYIPKQA